MGVDNETTSWLAELLKPLSRIVLGDLEMFRALFRASYWFSLMCEFNATTRCHQKRFGIQKSSHPAHGFLSRDLDRPGSVRYFRAGPLVKNNPTPKDRRGKGVTLKNK
jgi:hypothetical protein